MYQLLSVQIGNVTDCFVSDVGVSGFYTILAYSLSRYDLRLHVECKYTIVQINTQYNVLVNQVFANPVSVFILLGFSYDFRHSNVSSLPSLFKEVVGELPSCFLNLFLKSFLVCISESQDVSC